MRRAMRKSKEKSKKINNVKRRNLQPSATRCRITGKNRIDNEKNLFEMQVFSNSSNQF